MFKSDVLKYYKTAKAAAEALGINESAVSQWSEKIPRLRAFELERLTAGALKVEPEIIPDKAA